MGQVYKAYDSKGKREVAIKVFTPQKGTPSFFLAEFSALFRLNHPHLPQVYQMGETTDGRDYLVMELIEGKDILSSFLGSRYEHFLPVIEQICETLEFIHLRGYLHSDIKPGHILIDQKGQVKIIDLGLAQTISLPSGGKIRGTIGYIAPEVLRGLNRDQRADLYSLGVVLYEVWTGRKPFPYKGMGRLLEAYLHERPVPPSSLNPQIPVPFNRAILKLLRKEPAQRFQSALEIIESLDLENTGYSSQYFKYKFRFPQGQFTGRKRELERLFLGCQQMEEKGASSSFGRTRVFLIQGEEGMGKTRLLKEFKFQLQMRGDPFLLMDIPKEGGFPGVALNSSTFNLTSFNFPQMIPPTPYHSKSRIACIFRELTAKLVDMAQGKPLILLFDDLDRADAFWLEFWEFAAVNISQAILIGTYRGGGLDPQSRFSSIKEKLRQKGLLLELRLRPLNREDLVSLISSILGTSDSAPLVEVVEEQTGGNPLFVEELLNLLADMDLIYRSQGRWRIKGEKLLSFPLPGGTKQVLGRRVHLLKPQEKKLLEGASVIGYRFDRETLQQISEPEGIDERLGRLCRAQLILREESHPNRFRFSNRMLHRVVYEGMEEGLRVGLHRRLGSYLQRVKGEEKKSFIEIANHLLRGKQPVKSLPWFLKAGYEYAHHLLDYGKAINCYEEAIKIIEGEYGKTPWNLYQREGEALFSLGDYEQAWEEFHTIFKISLRRGDRVWQAKGQNGMGLACYCLGRYEEALSYLGNALKAIKSLPRRDLEIEITNNLSRVNQSLGYAQRAIRGYKRALWLSVAGRDEERREDTLLNLGYLSSQRGDYHAALNYFRQGKRVARKRGDKGGEAYAQLGRGNIYFYRSSFPLALRHYRAALSWAEQVGDRWMKGVSLNNISRIYIALGQYTRAMQLNDEARKILKEVGDKRGEALALINRGTIFVQREIHEKSRQFLAQALMMSQQTNFPRGMACALSSLADVHLALEDLAGARGFLGKAWEITGRLGDKELRARVLIGLATYELQAGNPSQAKLTLQKALTISRRIRYVELILSSLLLKGRLEMEGGSLGKALRLTNQAEELARPLRRRYDLARALIQLAQIEIENGRLEEARRLAETAKGMAQSFGMKGILWKAHYQLGRALYYQGWFAQAKNEYESCFQILQDIISEIEEEKFREAFQRKQEIKGFAQDVELLRRAY